MTKNYDADVQTATQTACKPDKSARVRTFFVISINNQRLADNLYSFIHNPRSAQYFNAGFSLVFLQLVPGPLVQSQPFMARVLLQLRRIEGLPFSLTADYEKG